ncbi:hypothetical protein [Streptomyces zagrosensis]|uniref:Uncharacterized protein n=1 Tax=Streptomyces zagrosensis TaxID=1042984 RepID=A0A7W9Q5N6_9ACTN|nr:hypothetical protein [Streptomyces zagrosensis]MBB5934000.1 hypothetical protein [Streptomyces zagrosensis]
MDDPTHVVLEPVPPEARKHDPLAVAFGNASLLGIGYVLLRRYGLATTQLLITIGLASMLVSVAETWCELVLLGWWVAVIAHGWLLADRHARRVTLRGQRLVALGLAIPVLLGVGALRADAVRIDRDVTEAREHGNCAGVLLAQDEVGFGHRLAGAPLAERSDETERVCRRLQTARDELATGLTGDEKALASGFDTLSAALEKPGNDQTVDAVLSTFLDALPMENPCRTVAVTDWLQRRNPRHDVLARSADTVQRVAPAALVACGDHLGEDDDWPQARSRYQQLLARYPDNALSAKARKGARKATLAIELSDVRSLLLSGMRDAQPPYCTNPAKYSGAAPYRKGATNRALFYGNDAYTNKLPGHWRTDDAAKAVLVVCVGEAEDDEKGTAVQTCSYQSDNAPYAQGDVTFHKIAIPVQVYEVRTGKRVADRTVEIGGTSCPEHFRHETDMIGAGPPSDMLVKASKADVRTAFSPLVNGG